LVNTEFSAEIGGAAGIEPSEVADELLIGLETNLFDIPVGDTKIYATAIGEAMSKLAHA